MSAVLLCVMLAPGAAPIPPVPANLASPPRPVRPDLSLVVIELMPNDGAYRSRVHRIGFRNGKALPTETVWQGDEEFCSPCGSHQIVADRFLVAYRAGVIDLRENKVLSTECEGDVDSIDDKKVTYRIKSSTRVEGLFAFEYATGTVTRLGNSPPRKWHEKLPSSTVLSPNLKYAIRWQEGDELFLDREGKNPKSLGKGFKMEEDPEVVKSRSRDDTYFPVLWLDNNRFLTQRDHGQLVAVDLDGNVTEVVTIKDAPKVASPSLSRAPDGTALYCLNDAYYQIDPLKKTAVKTEWNNLGHGFEVSWEAGERSERTVRYNGKGIGRWSCWMSAAQTAPGYLAIPVNDRQAEDVTLQRVAVWSAATGDWTMLKLDGSLTPRSIIGWIK
jgi:hypothetical protein